MEASFEYILQLLGEATVKVSLLEAAVQERPAPPSQCDQACCRKGRNGKEQAVIGPGYSKRNEPIPAEEVPTS